MANANTMFGLVNYEGKYLTAEKFGNQINVTGNALRSKQRWIYEHEDGDTMKGFLRSQHNKYLETTKNGNVVCENNEREKDFLFEVEINDDGKWAFKDIYGKYLAGNAERLYTMMKLNTESLWSIHITKHPCCNLRNISRKQYVNLCEDGFYANVDIPWGKEAILMLEYCKGKYAMKDILGRYLNGITGELENSCGQDCLFSISIQGNTYAFRASNGKYLTVHGPQGKIIAAKKAIGKDEWFAIEESKAQCIFTANNGKKVTTKQGIDVTANQIMEVGDTEIFQIGYHQGRTDKITFLARNKNYWMASEKSITASSGKVTPNCVFKIEWVDGKVALKAYNNKYIVSTSVGQLAAAGGSSNDPNSLFILLLVNKQRIVLRGDHGYMGLTNNKIQCNLGSVDSLEVILHNGKYRLKARNGSYLKLASDLSITGNSEEGDYFTFELYSMNKMQIKASNGKFLKGNQNGTLTAISDKSSNDTIWEY